MFLNNSNGVKVSVSEKTFFVDPTNSDVGNATLFLSHAHSDHARVFKNKTHLMTTETRDLLQKQENENLKTMKLNCRKKFEDCEITLKNAGHVLGSSQTIIENGERVVITSDFKLQDSILGEGAEILESDYLVIDSTFGLPKFSFPNREKTYEQIIKWTAENLKEGKFVLLGGYALGKAQELTKIINEFTKETPLVYYKIFDNNKIYEKNSVKLGDFIKLNQNYSEGNILLMPPHLIKPEIIEVLSLMTGKKVATGICSGWFKEGFYRNKARTFPLSDHADYKSILHYIKKSKPKKVYTTHGFCKELAWIINKKLGIPSLPLKEAGQTHLQDYND
ncbi:MAG: MBL fold metallo-hydrolase RNA specificity domain-containing protein [archaeon]